MLTKRDKFIIKHFSEADKLKEEPGFEFHKTISELRMSLFLFNKNLIDYDKSVKKFYSIQNIFSQEGIKRWHLQKLMLSNLHNTIISIISYYEKVKQNKRKLEIADEYEELWNKTVDINKFMLVNLIRDLSVHYGIIELNQNITIIQNSEEVFNIKELINKKQLTEYIQSSQKGIGKKYNCISTYLSELPDKIDILGILTQLRIEIQDFHKKLIFISASQKKKEIQEFIDKVENNKLQSIKNNIRTNLVISDSQLRLIKCFLK